MQAYQSQFIDFALDLGVLRFGEFVLKSGRQSPYFFNSGLFDSGASLARLAHFYVEAIEASGVGFDVLYGPAYKGIPLVAAVALNYAAAHERDVPYVFNRKEAKDHGEGGVTIGATLHGRTFIIDDVISAGTSTRESVEIIRAAGARAVGVAICLDRQERGAGRQSAIQEIRQQLGLDVISIITLDHLIEYLAATGGRNADLEAIRKYRSEYGTGPGTE